jgi:hypothetical protein
MKISKELAKVLREISREVAKWPEWKRSLDPIGDAGREKYSAIRSERIK